MNNVELVTRWSADWPSLTAETAAYFSDDAEYLNMPAPDRVITGAKAIGETLTGFLSRFERVENTVKPAAATGDTVIIERNEHFVLPGGAAFDLPCVGVFELREGLIVSWRDYFDMAALTSNMPAPAS